jgi:MauM/NapG family ferredoxin protein
MPKKPDRKIPLATYRIAVQLLFLSLFLVLFRMTDFGDSNELNPALNIFFRLDPLVALTAMMAGKTYIALLWPAIVIVVLTIFLGRFFCGWVCPMGTILDGAQKIIPAKNKGPAGPYRRIKFYLLAFVIVSSIFGLQLTGFFDPFSILFRTVTFSLDGAFHLMVSAPFDYIFLNGPEWMSNITEPVNKSMKGTVLPYEKRTYQLALLSIFIFVTIVFLERIERRFWCRNLCPLGALLALFAKFGLLRQQPGKACSMDCMTCADICRMGAISEEGEMSPESCNLCLDCVDQCDKQIISIKFKRPKAKPAPISLSRRGFIGSLSAGAILPAFVFSRANSRKTPDLLIRPPGALTEKDFLERCVRCGECMKVCVTNGLQPTLVEAGTEGMFSPILVPRTGYCEFNCTMCGQVCPTGAIEKKSVEDKREIHIGTAFFNKNLCMPYAKGVPCLVCEEMCPLHDKAIKLREVEVLNQQNEPVTLMQPYIIENLCIGCGTCEFNCPLTGTSAVRVTNANETRSDDWG